MALPQGEKYRISAAVLQGPDMESEAEAVQYVKAGGEAGPDSDVADDYEYPFPNDTRAERYMTAFQAGRYAID